MNNKVIEDLRNELELAGLSVLESRQLLQDATDRIQELMDSNDYSANAIKYADQCLMNFESATKNYRKIARVLAKLAEVGSLA